MQIIKNKNKQTKFYIIKRMILYYLKHNKIIL